MLELMVVLAILVLVFSSVPLIGANWFASTKIESIESDVVGAVRSIRLTAMKTGETQLLTDVTLRQAIESMGGSPDDFDLQVGNTVEFFPNGAATGGSIVLRDGDTTVRVDVIGLVGNVRVKGDTQK